MKPPRIAGGFFIVAKRLIESSIRHMEKAPGINNTGVEESLVNKEKDHLEHDSITLDKEIYLTNVPSKNPNEGEITILTHLSKEKLLEGMRAQEATIAAIIKAKNTGKPEFAKVRRQYENYMSAYEMAGYGHYQGQNADVISDWHNEVLGNPEEEEMETSEKN